jgi:hypothetical protein
MNLTKPFLSIFLNLHSYFFDLESWLLVLNSYFS